MANAQRLMLRLFSRLPNWVLLRMSGGKPISVRNRQLDPMMQLLWVQGKQQPSITALPLDQGRAIIDEAAALLAGPVSPKIQIEEERIPGPAGEIPVRVYRPREASSALPLLLFFHQGGFVIGGLETCHAFCALIAEVAGCVVLNVDYRLAPEHPFPAPVDDAMAAYGWATEHGGRFGADPTRVGVCGDSAGGMLSAVICQHAIRSGLQIPVCQVLIYPWLVPHSGLPSYTDFADAYPLSASIMEWFSDHYFTNNEQKLSPLAAPGVQPELAGLPPTLVAAAGFDPLSDEAEDYASRLKSAGVQVDYLCFDHLTHSFCMMGVVPAAFEAQRHVARWIRDNFGLKGN